MVDRYQQIDPDREAEANRRYICWRAEWSAEVEVQSSCTLTAYQVGRTWAVPLTTAATFFLPRPLKRDAIALRQDSGWTRKKSQPGVVELSSRNGHHERLIAHLKRRSGANPSHHVPGPWFWPTRAKRRANKVRGMLPPGIRVHSESQLSYALQWESSCDEIMSGGCGSLCSTG